MTLGSLLVSLFYLSIPWILLEAASRYFAPGASKPKLRSTREGLITTLNKITYGSTSISRGPLWIKLETTHLNQWPSSFLRRLQQTTRARRRSEHGLALPLNGNGNGHAPTKSQMLGWLEHVYQAGAIFAGIALFGSIAFLLWGALDVIGKLMSLKESSTQSSVGAASLMKRSDAVLSTPASPIASSWSPNLVPLIPGFTIPFNHLYPLIIALSLTQIVHEAGHAICAALYSWTPLHTGLVIIFPSIPGAFVTLPQEALEVDDKQSGIKRQIQIVSAGVWHNALTALTLALLLYGGIGSLSHSVFWKSADCLIVESVEGSSPLASHMPPGTLISAVNDLQLDDTDTAARRESMWRSYLTQDAANDEKGWCVPRELWIKGSSECCLIFNNSTTQAETNNKDLCFVPRLPQSGDAGRCFDPTRLLSDKAVSSRCSAACSDHNSICISPDSREQLIRINIRYSKNEKNRVILFQGSPKAVFSAVHLSPYIFRFDSLSPPYSLFRWWKLLLYYFLNLSMAMALLNMLPLPSLDGDVYLGLVLKTVLSRFDLSNSSSDVYDEEVAVEMESHGSLRTRNNIVSRQDDGMDKRLRNALLNKIKTRLRWFTIFVAVFVFGGSIVLHATGESIAP